MRENPQNLNGMPHFVWIKEIRIPFLLLPIAFVPAAVAIAWNHGSFSFLYALLVLVGVLCLHAGVNVLNDYFDYRSGIDLITTPTPFSGGSRILPSKQMTPNKVLIEGASFLLGGVLIGTYFIVALNYNPVLIALVAVAAVSVVGYSPIFAKYAIGELLAGLDLGLLVVLGAYYVLTREISLAPIFVGTTFGILTTCILYINEFPDTFADSQKGRMHLVARWGKQKAAERFKLLIGSAYAVLVLGVIVGMVTPFALISLLALPKAINATRVLSKNYDKTVELIPGMASTVTATLLTGGLVLLGYIISGILYALTGIRFY